MDKIKIIHCADLHLGSEISSMGHLGVKRRAEIKQSFYRILEMCNKEQVQYLLIAGDLYEQVNPQKELIKEVAEAFASLHNTKVIISPGNHDYISEDSHYNRNGVYPNHVLIFKGAWECMEFPEDNLRIWGAGFRSMYQKVSLMPDVDMHEKGNKNKTTIQIGVLHGELVSGMRESNYNPVTKQQIRNSGLDYLALGHIHLRTDVQKTGNTCYGYCGCHEGRGFDELGEKGIYMGEVSSGGCNLTFVPVCKRRYIQIAADITGAVNDAQAAQKVADAIYANVQLPQLEDHLYKVILQGTIEDSVSIHLEELRARLNEFYYIKFKDALEISVDYETIAQNNTLKGMFVRRMLSAIEELDNKGRKKEALAYRQGLTIGLKAFNGEVNYHEDK